MHRTLLALLVTLTLTTTARAQSTSGPPGYGVYPLTVDQFLQATGDDWQWSDLMDNGTIVKVKVRTDDHTISTCGVPWVRIPINGELVNLKRQSESQYGSQTLVVSTIWYGRTWWLYGSQFPTWIPDQFDPFGGPNPAVTSYLR